MIREFDAIILGAGAAGLFAGWQAALRGVSVLVIDHASAPGEKIRISGGGRCNFTNLHTTPDRFLSQNPHFARSALARYTAQDFISLVRSHGIAFHEKTLGQLFCDGKATRIVAMLVDGLRASGGTLELSTSVKAVARTPDGFHVTLSSGAVTARALVVATGGLSIPKMGATGLGYDLARQFGLRVIPPRPALVPFTFSGIWLERFAALSGVSLPVRVRAGTGPAFAEAMLFTHRGLSGPAVLQASSYWREGETVTVDLTAGVSDLTETLLQEKAQHPKRALATALAAHFPSRLAAEFPVWLADTSAEPMPNLAPTHAQPLSNTPLTHFQHLSKLLGSLNLSPSGTEGWRTAEVTAGGVNTDDLQQRTLASRTDPALFFIGEVVDVTGWLGGYNFQWAWASAHACAEALAALRGSV
jgi:hypothetical protein